MRVIRYTASPGRGGEASLDAEGVRLLDGEEELFVQQLRGGVGRQVEAVEAGVRAREGLHAAPALDAEAARAGGAAQRREALVGNGRRARHELYQPKPLLVRESERQIIVRYFSVQRYYEVLRLRAFCCYLCHWEM